MSNRLDQDQARYSFGHHLGPICSQSLSADDTRVIKVISKTNVGLFFHEYHQSFNKYLYHNLYCNFAEPDLVPNCLLKYSADDKNCHEHVESYDTSRTVSHFNEFYFAVLA